MALRMIEIIVPNDRAAEIEPTLEGHRVVGVWRERLREELVLARVLVDVVDTEQVLDAFEDRFRDTDGFRLILHAVEATVPRPESPTSTEDPHGAGTPSPSNRISRAELYEDIAQFTNLTAPYVAMVALSAVVASIGILRDEVAIIIGAMVIAPLLGPNVALSLGTTLGDLVLVRRALLVGLAGLVTAFVPAAIIGIFATVDAETVAIASRTNVGLDDAALALAAGAAGAIAFTTGLPATVIGVMVAVALVPPLVVSALLAGAGLWAPSASAAVLAVVNLIGINLSGVAVFLIQGIRPLTWWETERAKRATRIAILLWAGLLLAFAFGILWPGPGD